MVRNEATVPRHLCKIGPRYEVIIRFTQLRVCVYVLYLLCSQNREPKCVACVNLINRAIVGQSGELTNQNVNCPYTRADPVIKSPQRRWEVTQDWSSVVIKFPTTGSPSSVKSSHHLPHRRVVGQITYRCIRFTAGFEQDTFECRHKWEHIYSPVPMCWYI